jgi:aarF domain-containing kinase
MQLLLPPEYCETFEPMCMSAPRTPFSDVKKIVESEIGRPMSEIFDYFEEEPLASASLAQVHRAKLKGSDEIVAVKVQHMWIREQVPGDLRLIQFATDVACSIFPDFKYGWLPHEF